MKKILYLLTLSLTITSCADIGSAMFFGGDGDYNFSNDQLDAAYQIDESKIHLFTVPSDEDTIHGLFLGDFSQLENDTIIYYLHGNGSSMDVFWSTVAVLANLGEQHRYGVVMYDYRGYGKSTGSTQNAATMQAHYEAVMKWMEARGLTADRLVVMANS